MRIYYDCEFLENGETIRLISIGMIREDGKKYYAVVKDQALMQDVYDHPWLRENVWPSLPTGIINGKVEFVMWPGMGLPKNRVDITNDVRIFIQETPNPELWAYYGAYDHVVLCQLWGQMIDLPNGIPMYTNDLQQEITRLGNPRVPEQTDGLHNALSDAEWVKSTYEYLMEELNVIRK